MKSQLIAAAVQGILQNAVVDQSSDGKASIDLAKLPDFGLSAAMWEVAYQLAVMNERAEQDADFQIAAARKAFV